METCSNVSLSVEHPFQQLLKNSNQTIVNKYQKWRYVSHLFRQSACDSGFCLHKMSVSM